MSAIGQKRTSGGLNKGPRRLDKAFSTDVARTAGRKSRLLNANPARSVRRLAGRVLRLRIRQRELLAGLIVLALQGDFVEMLNPQVVRNALPASERREQPALSERLNEASTRISTVGRAYERLAYNADYESIGLAS